MQVELVIDQLAGSTGSCEAALEALEALARVCWADEDAREVAASEAGAGAMASAIVLQGLDATSSHLEHSFRQATAPTYHSTVVHCLTEYRRLFSLGVCAKMRFGGQPMRRCSDAMCAQASLRC